MSDQPKEEDFTKMQPRALQIEPKDVVCDNDVPTLLIDGFQGATVINGTLRLNLFEDRFNVSSPEDIERRIVTRLVLPIGNLEGFVGVLETIKNDLIKGESE